MEREFLAPSSNYHSQDYLEEARTEVEKQYKYMVRNLQITRVEIFPMSFPYFTNFAFSFNIWRKLELNTAISKFNWSHYWGSSDWKAVFSISWVCEKNLNPENNVQYCICFSLYFLPVLLCLTFYKDTFQSNCPSNNCINHVLEKFFLAFIIHQKP